MTDTTNAKTTLPEDRCGLIGTYTPGECVKPRGHRGDHVSQYNRQFTRGNWPERRTEADPSPLVEDIVADMAGMALLANGGRESTHHDGCEHCGCLRRQLVGRDFDGSDVVKYDCGTVTLGVQSPACTVIAAMRPVVDAAVTQVMADRKFPMMPTVYNALTVAVDRYREATK